MFNLSIVQYIQLAFLFIAIIAFCANIIIKFRFNQHTKQFIPIDIINSAILPHKFIYAEPEYTDNKFKAVYLIGFESYDLDTIEYQSLNTENREYSSFLINSAEYIIVDTSITEISRDYLTAVEDGYTKAVFIILQSSEYYYFDVKYPEINELIEYRFKSKHNGKEQARISRDELKHYRVLGKVISIAK